MSPDDDDEAPDPGPREDRFMADPETVVFHGKMELTPDAPEAEEEPDDRLPEDEDDDSGLDLDEGDEEGLDLEDVGLLIDGSDDEGDADA